MISCVILRCYHTRYPEKKKLLQKNREFARLFSNVLWKSQVLWRSSLETFLSPLSGILTVLCIEKRRYQIAERKKSELLNVSKLRSPQKVSDYRWTDGLLRDSGNWTVPEQLSFESRWLIVPIIKLCGYWNTWNTTNNR